MISTLNAILCGTALCKGCGQPFKPIQTNQLRCKPSCGRGRTRLRTPDNGDKRSQVEKNRARAAERAGPREFICIDGEGITDKETGEHKYVLISCGDKHFSYDGAALEFGEIMHFLWNCYLARPRAIYVGFYLKYDWAQWIRSLPLDRAKALLDPEMVKKRKRKFPHLPPFPVTHSGWDFDYLPGKRFKLRPAWLPKLFGEEMERHKGWDADKEMYEEGGCKGCDLCQCPWEWMWINDVGPYFQMSLLKAINPNDKKNPNPVCTPEEYEIIKRGKDRRNNAEYDPEMIRYNQLECEVTSRLMDQQAAGMAEEGLRPNRDQWYGPGQLAQLWMRKIRVPTGAEIRAAVPQEVRDAARAAYYGGWFEIFWHGPYQGTSYTYDINSAYPKIMSQLPCLLHGAWVYEDGKDIKEYAEFQLVRARVRGRNTVVGAMLHRSQGKRILRPLETEGWFWGRELKAAIDAGFVKDYELFERWRYVPCDCPPPLAAIADLYEGRLAMGKNSPTGKARKLVYNSCYGKFAQSVGEPVFGNAVYASATTAGCRAMICDCIASHPKGADALLAVATDSATFRWPHPKLSITDKLGDWDVHEHKNLSLFMPGIYWDDKTRAAVASGERGVFKSRGIAARDLSKHLYELDRAWLRFSRRGWPTMTLPVSFQLISPKQALDRGDWSLCGQVLSGKDAERTICADPELKRWALGPERSKPLKRGRNGLASLPYDGAFGDELREMNDEELGDHPDGPILQLDAEVLHDR